jgi:hypothetical protein
VRSREQQQQQRRALMEFEEKSGIAHQSLAMN